MSTEPSTPIFDQLIIELHFSPFRELDWPPPEWSSFPTACPICGTIGLSRFPVPEHDDPICRDCWMLNRHKEPEQWHCCECGKFLRAPDRMVVWCTSGAVYMCREHFDHWKAATPNMSGTFRHRDCDDPTLAKGEGE